MPLLVYESLSTIGANLQQMAGYVDPFELSKKDFWVLDNSGSVEKPGLGKK